MKNRALVMKEKVRIQLLYLPQLPQDNHGR